MDKMKNLTREIPIFKHSPNDDECIYHYTKVPGAIGILSGKKIWLTNITCLNDWMEGRYFYNQLLDSLKDRKDVYKNLLELYEKCFENTYIASFSKKPELLSQYKYYGNICLAFNILDIHESRSKLNNYATSGFEVNTDVRYNPEELTETISMFAKNNELLDKVISKDMYSLLKFFCFFGVIKHRGFSEEQESRICHIWYDPKEIKYRYNDEQIIPYIEFKILPNTIRKIIIGPHSHQDKIYCNFLDFVMQNKEFEHVEVTCSDIPFIP